MASLHLKPVIAADELDGTNTFGIFALLFPKPAASLEGSEGESIRDPQIARALHVGHSGQCG